MIDEYSIPIKKNNDIDNVIKWKEESNKKLEEGGHNLRVVNSKLYTFILTLSVILTILLIVGGWYFLSLIKDGSFKSLTNQEVSLNPLFNASVSIMNSYNNTFDPSVSNNYIYYNNYTIINEINLNCTI